ncbi:MAG: helix-turn-helix transcriptional regulator [Chloroflexaceae bacterium]
MARSGGSKRSSWLIFRRRLVIVRTLLRGPAQRGTLWDAARTELGDDAWGTAPDAALRHDLAALRREFGCVIAYRAARGYHLVDPGNLALLDLPDAHLHALHLLAGLADTLPPHLREPIAELLAQIISLLPPARRMVGSDGAGEQVIAPQSVTDLDRTMLRRIRHAVGHQHLQFQYRSTFTSRADGIAHRVAPYGLLVRDGHLYLDADCLWADSPECRPRALRYRLDRIVPASLQVLPEVVPPLRRSMPTYELRYELAPAVARRHDVALHFAGSHVTYRDDGSALVTAIIDDPWHARLTLLRYGANCRVLAPPEVMTLMRETARDLAAIYEI